MNKVKNVSKQSETSVDKKLENTASTQSTSRQKVDIIESASHVTIIADMPGVNADSLDIEIDKGILSVSGVSLMEATTDHKACHVEFKNPRYQRRFTLSNDLDQEQVTASLIQGVLNLAVAKKEAAKPRKIKVKAA